MTEDLRKDLMAIVLEEAFAYNPAYADRLIALAEEHSEIDQEDSAAYESALYIVDRFNARCSKIVG